MFDPITNVGLGLAGLALFIAALQWFRLGNPADRSRPVTHGAIAFPSVVLSFGIGMLGLTLLWHGLIRWVI